MVQRGKVWKIAASLSSVNEDAAPTLIWSKMRPTFVGAGWAPIVEKDVKTLRYQKGTKDSWASVNIVNADEIRIVIVEQARAK